MNDKLIYIALPVCNVSGLIKEVLYKLFNNTNLPFILSVCDNYSKDDTYQVIKSWIEENVNKENSLLQRLYLCNFTERKNSVQCINQSLDRAKDFPNVSMVVKLDHDFGVPEKWAETCLSFLEHGFDLVSPATKKETPKGFQYYTVNQEPSLKLKHSLTKEDIWCYDGIAGYCHCFKPETLKKNQEYRYLYSDNIFGSEDAEWSLRCGPVHKKGYIMSLEGWHWSKPDIGKYEDIWKAAATFGETHLQWEEWAEKNLPL